MARFFKILYSCSNYLEQGDLIMSKSSSSKIIDNILKTLENFPEGASLEDIFKNLFPAVSKRSLQRYLAVLSAEKRLTISGKARSILYHPPLKKNDLIIDYKEGAKSDFPVFEKAIPLSNEALSIQMEIRQPIQARRPVGYNRDFLNKYRPNESYYLTENMRKHLFAIGKSPDGERPAGTYARQILNRLLIDLSWNSSRLEGNTYSLLETERLLQLGEASEGKNSFEAQMILNHKAAIEFMVESADLMSFSPFVIFNLHALLSDNLLHDQRACGCLRSQAVGIAKSVYQPLAIPQLIQDYFHQILETANLIQDPFEQSFFVMVQLPYLQPFLDVNKRVSRLAANIPFIRENLCPLSFVDVPEQAYVSGLLGIYELNRIELLREVYIWAYERSSALYSATRQELGEPDRLRLKHRQLILDLMGVIIRGCMDKKTAVHVIKQNAIENLAENERGRFVEIMENELMSLHKGNIARFKIKPGDYDKWLETWN